MENLTWEAFVQCIADYVGVDADEIREETDIFEDLCVDSLGLFGLGTYITETFKVNIPLSSVASIYKIGDMFNLLKKEGTPIE